MNVFLTAKRAWNPIKSLINITQPALNVKKKRNVFLNIIWYIFIKLDGCTHKAARLFRPELRSEFRFYLFFTQGFDLFSFLFFYISIKNEEKRKKTGVKFSPKRRHVPFFPIISHSWPFIATLNLQGDEVFYCMKKPPGFNSVSFFHNTHTHKCIPFTSCLFPL